MQMVGEGMEKKIIGSFLTPFHKKNYIHVFICQSPFGLD